MTDHCLDVVLVHNNKHESCAYLFIKKDEREIRLSLTNGSKMGKNSSLCAHHAAANTYYKTSSSSDDVCTMQMLFTSSIWS